MVGRGAKGNPWIFKRITHYLETGELLPGPTLMEVRDMILRHGKMLTEYKGEICLLYTSCRLISMKEKAGSLYQETASAMGFLRSRAWEDR